ncbi:hypothetical protein GO615_16240 [Aromatoleum evansii]|nr:hypothetical protein [Aromatoleum evansii]
MDAARSVRPMVVDLGAAIMTAALSPTALQGENRRFRNTGGRSEENRPLGFRPAFKDVASGAVYDSRFADGRPAPFHLLDGLPEDVILHRDPTGRVGRVKDSIVSGFVLNGQFYTREEAAQEVAALAA